MASWEAAGLYASQMASWESGWLVCFANGQLGKRLACMLRKWANAAYAPQICQRCTSYSSWAVHTCPPGLVGLSTALGRRIEALLDLRVLCGPEAIYHEEHEELEGNPTPPHPWARESMLIPSSTS